MGFCIVMFKMAVLVALLALAACGTAEAKVIPPCTPAPGSLMDPCEQDVPHLAYHEIYHGQKMDIFTGPTPKRIRSAFSWDNREGFILAQFVVRATYLPGTVRCVTKDRYRPPDYAAADEWTGVDKRDPSKFYLGVVQCFVDIRVNDYIVGKGPSRLSVVLKDFFYWREYDTEEKIEGIRTAFESVYISGGDGFRVEAPPEGILGREYIHFLSIAADHSVEGLESFWAWDVERASDGTILAVHPHRQYWQSKSETYKTQRRALVEMPLDAFISEVQLEHQNLVEDRKRNPGLEEYRLESYYRMLSSVDELHQFYVDLGATAHPSGPPALPPPP